MPQEVQIRSGSGIIHVRSFGLVTLTDVERSCKAVESFVQARGIRKVLVDTTEVEQGASTMEIYSIAQTIASNPAFIGVRHAVLVRHGNRDKLSFLEDVAVNRGAQLALFFSEAEAITWLNAV